MENSAECSKGATWCCEQGQVVATAEKKALSA